MSISIGVCNYNNLTKLKSTISGLLTNISHETKELIIVDNKSSDPEVPKFLGELESRVDKVPIKIIRNNENRWYQGAVNQIFKLATQDVVIYCDNDIEVKIPEFDLILRNYLYRFHEIGIIFPFYGGFMRIDRGTYIETDWALGCMFAMTRHNFHDVGGMDEDIGHQNEVDLCLRIRMKGLKCAMAREVSILHHASASSSSENNERISKGVIEFINKWNNYFAGSRNANYHSPNVLRWEDFPINRIYRKEYFKELLKRYNHEPVQVQFGGVLYDLIIEPKTPDFYRV